jgi:molybdopterin-containing oxidoreductase family iron-sulfur binding subunit
MHKTEDGLTMINPSKCIGCRVCQLACPYGVIYFNESEPHGDVREDSTPIIPDCTSTGEEMIEKGDVPIPVYNPDRATSIPGIRSKGVVEKCTFCDHKVAKGELPACVEACPADARIFGDLNDSNSAPRRALAKHQPKVLQPEKGTNPNVFYIRDV